MEAATMFDVTATQQLGGARCCRRFLVKFQVSTATLRVCSEYYDCEFCLFQF